jgi:hypothetical protein
MKESRGWWGGGEGGGGWGAGGGKVGGDYSDGEAPVLRPLGRQTENSVSRRLPTGSHRGGGGRAGEEKG